MRTTATRILLAISVASLVLAACGSDDDDAADDTTTTTAAPEATTVEVTMIDYAYEGLPASVEAGTQFTVTNATENNELHEFVAIHLAADETRTLDEIAALSEEELGALLGGEPAAVLLAPPGGPMIPAVGDGTLTEPGRYAIMCFIPTGIDPQVYLDAAAETEAGPPQVEGGGPPHFFNGMRAELTVT